MPFESYKTDHSLLGLLAALDFIEKFEKQNDIPIEPVYSGKMFYGIYDLILKGYFKKGATILAIHTGGLQGLGGMKEKIKRINNSYS